MNQNNMISGIETNFEITKFIMTPTKPSYKDVYKRSYDLNVTSGTLNTLENLFHNSPSGSNGVLNKTELVHNIPDIMAISDKINGRAEIANGWSTERLRYILVTESEINGTKYVYYIQGYSEYYDPTYNNNIDDNMLFYINSITIFTKMINIHTGQLIVRPTSSFNIIRDDNNNGSYAYNPMKPSENELIRPMDLVNNINAIETHGGPDNVINNIAGTITGGSKTSSRDNSNPLDMFIKTVNGVVDAKNTTSLSYGTDREVYRTAAATLSETNPLSVPFISMLYKMTNNSTPTTFTLALLNTLDPLLQHKTTMSGRDLNNPVNMNSLDTMNTEDLFRPTIESKIAVTVAQSINAIMFNNFVAGLSVSINNVTGQYITLVTYISSYVDGVDTIYYSNKIRSECNTNLLPEITHNGQIMVDIQFFSETDNDTTVEISVNGQQPVVFRFPTFADSLYTPVVTDSANKAAITNDLGDVLDKTYSADVSLHDQSHDQFYM